MPTAKAVGIFYFAGRKTSETVCIAVSRSDANDV